MAIAATRDPQQLAVTSCRAYAKTIPRRLEADPAITFRVSLHSCHPDELQANTLGGEMRKLLTCGVVSILVGVTAILAQDAPGPAQAGPDPGRPERSPHRSAPRHAWSAPSRRPAAAVPFRHPAGSDAGTEIRQCVRGGVDAAGSSAGVQPEPRHDDAGVRRSGETPPDVQPQHCHQPARDAGRSYWQYLDSRRLSERAVEAEAEWRARDDAGHARRSREMGRDKMEWHVQPADGRRVRQGRQFLCGAGPWRHVVAARLHILRNL